MNPSAIVLSGDGINCEIETVQALEMAGFDAKQTHVSELLAAADGLGKTRLLVLPGGFSFGDEIASGKVLAIKLMEGLKDSLSAYVDSGRLILGICNGFQAIIQMGVIPSPVSPSERFVSLVRNANGRFINRWVRLSIPDHARRGYLEGIESLELPVRHGEGRIVCKNDKRDLLQRYSALTYEEDINGSLDRIAGLTNEEGTILGMMPHPEAFARWTQHPAWTKLQVDAPELFDGSGGKLPDGLRILKNARALASSL